MIHHQQGSKQPDPTLTGEDVETQVRTMKTAAEEGAVPGQLGSRGRLGRIGSVRSACGRSPPDVAARMTATIPARALSIGGPRIWDVPRDIDTPPGLESP